MKQKQRCSTQESTSIIEVSLIALMKEIVVAAAEKDSLDYPDMSIVTTPFATFPPPNFRFKCRRQFSFFFSKMSNHSQTEDFRRIE